MQVLDLGKIRTAKERIERVYEADVLGRTEDYRVTAAVSLEFDIHKDKRQFRLVGRVATTLELACSRCLEPFIWAVDNEFDLRYQPNVPPAPGAEREIEADDLAASVYEEDQIDLDQLLQEQFYLTLPMKPLCEPGCKGLCPNCGTNLNRGTCTCETHWEDPRLAALRALKKES